MTIDEMRAAAFEQVLVMTDADCKPVITDSVPDILARHQRAVIWEASTAYAYNAVMQLPTRNGHRYRCLTAGTSASTQAAFPEAQYAGCPAHRVTDGTVVWVEDGADFDNVFDVRGAAHEGCHLKAVKASSLVSLSSGNSRVEASDLQAHWKARAAEFAPLGFG